MDSPKGSMIHFQDFHLQGSFKSVPFLLLYFNCLIFTPDDCTVDDYPDDTNTNVV